MALKVKSAADSAVKWGDNASRASDRYAVEAEAAASSWATNTGKAADNYHSAVTGPGIKERFRKGVSKAGADKYARKIRDVARDRFAPGIEFGKTDYQTGVEPFLQTIAGLSLSSRKPRGDPANYRRVEEVGKALNQKRLAMLGASAPASAS